MARHSIYTKKPAHGNGRRAWEKYQRDEGKPPYSVSYTPNYQYELKGWVCEESGPGALIPGYQMHPNHKFYPSSELSMETTELVPGRQTRAKQTYSAGDHVETPLGSGTILSCRTIERPEGQIRCRVRHDDYSDQDGDTFELDVEQLRHTPT